MTPRPDEDHDVIIHQSRGRIAGGAYKDTWRIWLGTEKQGERDSLEAAIELARNVAAAHSRPVWLRDETGHPLQPIEPVAIHRGRVDVPRPLPDLDEAPACPRCRSADTRELGDTRASAGFNCNQCDHTWLVRRPTRQPSPPGSVKD